MSNYTYCPSCKKKLYVVDYLDLDSCPKCNKLFFMYMYKVWIIASIIIMSLVWIIYALFPDKTEVMLNTCKFISFILAGVTIFSIILDTILRYTTDWTRNERQKSISFLSASILLIIILRSCGYL